MKHPATYMMTRDEWLDLNSVLAGCALALSIPTEAKRKGRLERTRNAQTIMGKIYERAVFGEGAAK